MDLDFALELELEGAVAAEEQLTTSLSLLDGMLSDSALHTLTSDLVVRATRTEELRGDVISMRQSRLMDLLAA